MNFFHAWRCGSSSQFAVSTTTKNSANWMVGNSNGNPACDVSGIVPNPGAPTDSYIPRWVTLCAPPPELAMSSNTHLSEAPRRAPRPPAPRPTRRVTRRGWVVLTVLPLLAVAGTYLGLTRGGELGLSGIVDGAVLGA